MIADAIRALVEGRSLSEEAAEGTMTQIMQGEATQAQIGAFLTALRLKGETVAEITAFARVMRSKVTPVEYATPGEVLDTCGTGGDGSGSFNISTAAAFVAAGAGVPVAKHGNRSVSSLCGSADLLKELGVNIEAGPQTALGCLNEAGICFIFAPLFHPAMKHAIGPRREIGIRTVFNILGPLTNPAGAKYQLLGVYSEELAGKLAGVLGRLGSKKAYVVHGHGNLDEISISGPTKVSELQEGQIKNYTVKPEDFGFEPRPVGAIRGGDAATNSRILKELLNCKQSPYREAVLLNAGAAISAFKEKFSIAQGVEFAVDSIDSGKAREKLEALIELSNSPE
jgi:anthranilate phosphoribosyltransferase